MSSLTLNGRASFASDSMHGTYAWVDVTQSVGSYSMSYDALVGSNRHKQYRGMAFRASLDLTNARALTQCVMNMTLYTTSPNCAGNVTCYLYNFDPFEGQTLPLSSIPSGYIKSVQQTVPDVAGSSQRIDYQRAFTFSGLNITSGGYLYFLFDVYRTSDNMPGEECWISSALNRQNLSGYFKGVPTGLSVSPSTVPTGGNLSVNITNYWTTETVEFYYNSTRLGSATITNGSGTVNIPKSWFTTAGITTAQSMTVQARLVSTTLTKNFTVQAGSDMKPTVTTPAITIVQDPAASDFPGVYIANISKAKVAVTVASGSNAGISSVRLDYTGGSPVNMTYNSGTQKYEATVGPITGNTTFTVTVTDVRGMTQQASYTLTGVVQYTSPVITISEPNTFRCDSGGTREDGGAYVRAQGSVAITTEGLSGNSLQSFRFYILEEPSKGSALTNGTQCAATAGRSFDYYETLVFEASDKIMTVTKSQRLPPGTRNLTMMRSSTGTYIGIGVLPQRTTGKSSVDLQEGGGYYEGGYLWGTLTRLDLSKTDGSQFSKNFKNVDTGLLYSPQNAECYFSKSNDTGWSNSPVSGSFTGIRKVVWIDGSHYFVIILEMAPTAGRIWISYNGGSWKSLTPS